jgi:hypothetical protein
LEIVAIEAFTAGFGILINNLVVSLDLFGSLLEDLS